MHKAFSHCTDCFGKPAHIKDETLGQFPETIACALSFRASFIGEESAVAREQQILAKLAPRFWNDKKLDLFNMTHYPLLIELTLSKVGSIVSDRR